MKLIVVLILLLGTCLALIDLVAGQPDQEWLLFKSRHGKIYRSRAEESMRRKAYTLNKQRIERFNVKESGYKLGLNHMSDWTSNELERFVDPKMPEVPVMVNALESQKFLNSLLDDRSTTVPDSVDWRDAVARVTTVRDQGGKL